MNLEFTIIIEQVGDVLRVHTNMPKTIASDKQIALFKVIHDHVQRGIQEFSEAEKFTMSGASVVGVKKP